MNTTLRFGIIGCGTAGHFHAKAIHALDSALLTAVYDFSAANARKFAAEYGAQVFENMEDLLGCPQVDAVCICTPSGLHAAQALAAVAHMKHVLIEKPLATTLEDARLVTEAAKEAGVVVDVVAQLRLSDAVRRIREALAFGKLGTLTLCQLDMVYYRSEDYYASSPWRGTWKMDGGGAMMNQGIHGMDLLLYLLGPVKRVFGNVKTMARPIETEDTAAAILEFENGVVCTVAATTSVYPGSPRCLRICGTKGTVTLTEDILTGWSVEGEAREEGGQLDYQSFSRPDTVPVSAHLRVLQDFAQAVHTGRSPVSTAVDGFNAVALIKSVYASSKTGTPQVPDYITPDC